MEIADIIKNIVDYGFLSVSAAITLFFITKYINIKINNINIVAGKEKRRTLKDLKEHHEVFRKLNALINYQIPNFSFKNKPIRTRLFKEMVDVKLRAIKNSLLDMISSENILDKGKLYRIAENTVQLIVQEYTSEWKEMGVPQIVIDKFDEWHLPRIIYLTDSIKLIGDSDFLDTPIEKIYGILNTYLSVVTMTVLDMEKTLVYLNGELTGKTYKGGIIE